MCSPLDDAGRGGVHACSQRDRALGATCSSWCPPTVGGVVGADDHVVLITTGGQHRADNDDEPSWREFRIRTLPPLTSIQHTNALRTPVIGP